MTLSDLAKYSVTRSMSGLSATAEFLVRLRRTTVYVMRPVCVCQHHRVTKAYELQTSKPEDIRVIEYVFTLVAVKLYKLS